MDEYSRICTKDCLVSPHTATIDGMLMFARIDSKDFGDLVQPSLPPIYLPRFCLPFANRPKSSVPPKTHCTKNMAMMMRVVLTAVFFSIRNSGGRINMRSISHSQHVLCFPKKIGWRFFAELVSLCARFI